MKRSEITRAQAQAQRQFAEAGIPTDPTVPIEIADFGLGRYAQEGLALIVRVNEAEYCSKYMALLPGQACPAHYHTRKKETFFALRGMVELVVDGEAITLAPGEQYTLRPGANHTFRAPHGAVIEEVSTHDENSDSYFDNPHVVRDTTIEED